MTAIRKLASARETFMLREATVVYRPLALELEGSSIGLGREACADTVGVLARLWISDRAAEHIVAFALDGRGMIIGASVLGVGGATWAMLDRAELLRFLIVAGAEGLVLAHNHPSGQVDPSPEDLALTLRVADACDAVGLELLDHVIVGQGSRSIYSFRAAGMIPGRRHP